MATHTWVDLHIAEATKLADLSGILFDLQRARDFAELLSGEFAAENPNWRLVEPLSIAATVMYSRPFLSGARYRLGEEDVKGFTSDQRAAHDYLRAYRDKHVAHSVNAFEENIPRANYCVERVQEEGITSISFGSGRVVGLSSSQLNAITELTTLLQVHVEAQIATEQARLLPIVRNLSLDQILTGGQKVFGMDTLTKVTERRKR